MFERTRANIESLQHEPFIDALAPINGETFVPVGTVRVLDHCIVCCQMKVIPLDDEEYRVHCGAKAAEVWRVGGPLGHW